MQSCVVDTLTVSFAAEARRLEEKLAKHEAEREKLAEKYRTLKQRFQDRLRLRDLANDQIEDEFRCPITHEIMNFPVIAADGFSYEQAAIERWLQERKTSPLTGQALPHYRLLDNLTLKAAILSWKDHRGDRGGATRLPRPASDPAGGGAWVNPAWTGNEAGSSSLFE